MKIFNKYFVFLLFIMGVSSCKPTRVCPAYHSYFILDRDVTRSTFSLFGPDSLPKDPEEDLWMIDKKKVGIADDLPYKKKVDKQAIISMESIYLKKEDPLDQMAMAETDSATLDSVRYHQRLQNDDFYNYDQMIYLHYFGDYLPKPSEKPQTTEDDLKKDKSLIKDEEEPQEEKKKGFLGGIFGKKKDKDNEKSEEATDEEPDATEEEDVN